MDSECTVQYRGGCVPDPDKYYTRIDFHVLGITYLIVIVECDENGHKDYELTCELSRMGQVHEAILKARDADGAEDLPVFLYDSIVILEM